MPRDYPSRPSFRRDRREAWLRRFAAHAAAAAMDSISFCSMVLLATLLALRLANAPLTLFAFLGGAMAIGVGIGSQNLINNVMSGPILFAERPIRVGDMISPLFDEFTTDADFPILKSGARTQPARRILPTAVTKPQQVSRRIFGVRASAELAVR